ncbi:hypothetical protein RJ641_030734 [Dillenia turbinata]|uniref:Uncharacterized protein n=1 Tax=Dillenia turbinata TaxID=194707 RepID=A0AAN8VWU0_9MAGN
MARRFRICIYGVTFGNIHLESVRNPPIIDQFPKPVQTKPLQLLSQTSLTQALKAPTIDAIPCTNLTFSDIELLPAIGDIVLDPFCGNAYGDLQTLTIPPVSCLQEGVPQSIIENKLCSSVAPFGARAML